MTRIGLEDLMSTTSPGWLPTTWRDKPARQLPSYPDAAALHTVEARLAGYPPWVLQVRPVA